jgi:hypothetical protein
MPAMSRALCANSGWRQIGCGDEASLEEELTARIVAAPWGRDRPSYLRVMLPLPATELLTVGLPL